MSVAIAAWLVATLMVQNTPTQEVELLAVKFHSHICGPCLILDIRMDPIETEFSSAPVEFVRIDQTFGTTRARRQAETMGLGEVYSQAGGATGFILLVDSSNGNILDRITIAQDPTEIRQRLSRALHFASQTD